MAEDSPLDGPATPPADAIPSLISGSNWFHWKDFAFRPESQIAKSKAKGVSQSKHAPAPRRVSHSSRPLFERLVFAALRAADDPECPERILQEIHDEIDKQMTMLQRFKLASQPRVQARQNEASQLRERAKTLGKQRADVRQKWLRAVTARFQDQGRRNDENIGSPDDIDVTIAILEDEIDIARKEVVYLKAAFGEADGPEEEDAAEEIDADEIDGTSGIGLVDEAEDAFD
jgi:hypothetical protein